METNKFDVPDGVGDCLVDDPEGGHPFRGGYRRQLVSRKDFDQQPTVPEAAEGSGDRNRRQTRSRR